MSISINKLIAAAAVLAMLAASMCMIAGVDSDASSDVAPAASYPDGSVSINTQDSDGDIVQVYTQIPERVIVGNVTCLEMLLYFGLGDRIVGIYYLEDEVWSELQDEFQEVVDRLDPQYVMTGLISQAVATALEPDLIMGYKSSFGDSNWSVGSTEYWNDLGCNVWSLNSQAGETNVEGMKQDYRDLGEIFQIQDATDKYISDFDEASASVNTEEPVNVAIFEYKADSTSYANYGDSSFIGDAVKHCNGVNVYADQTSVDKATLISSMQLQAIIIVAFGDYTPEQAVEDMLSDETLQDVPAVKNGHVIGIGLSQTYGGVQALSVMQQMSELLSEAASDTQAGEDLSDSGDSTLLYVAVVIIVILVIIIAAYVLHSRKKTE